MIPWSWAMSPPGLGLFLFSLQTQPKFTNFNFNSNCKTKSTIGNLLSSFIDSSSSEMSLSYRDYLTLLLLRPLFAIAVVFSFISVGWWLAWKLVLVHVPLVQEIFGLRKKTVKPKPQTGRLSKFYSTIEARNSASKW